MHSQLNIDSLRKVLISYHTRNSRIINHWPHDVWFFGRTRYGDFGWTLFILELQNITLDSGIVALVRYIRARFFAPHGEVQVVSTLHLFGWDEFPVHGLVDFSAVTTRSHHAVDLTCVVLFSRYLAHALPTIRARYPLARKLISASLATNRHFIGLLRPLNFLVQLSRRWNFFQGRRQSQFWLTF